MRSIPVPKSDLLKVIEFAGKNNRGENQWKCQCKCGNICVVKTANLKSGRTKSCGCIKNGPKRRKITLEVGDRVNSVVITHIEWSKKYRFWIYSYRCDCGREKKTYRNVVLKSCGCHSWGRAKRNFYHEISGSHWRNIINGAKARNIEFKVSIEYAWNLFLKQDRKCAYSGVELVFNYNSADFNKKTASLDRIDSSKPYEEGNVQWVHKRINLMKGSMSDEEFLEWNRKIYEQRIAKQT